MFLKEVKLSNWAVSICMWTPQKENIISDEIVLGIQFNNNKIHLGCIGLGWLVRNEARLRYHLPRLARMFNPMPVYWSCDSRDCDHVRSISAHRSPTGWHFIKSMDNTYADAEGPTYISIISKNEHRNFESSWRDYNAEAFEDGHSHSPRY